MKRTVLIAEDEALLAEAIAATLDREGLEIVVAYDGDEALAKAQSLHPDLVLLDVMMPKRSGIEVCATLKSDPATRSIPVVLLTAKRKRADRDLGMAAGADKYLTKPFSPTDLIDLVDEVLSGGVEALELRGRQELERMSADQLSVYAQELRALFEQERAERQALEEARRHLEDLDQLKAAFIGAVTHELLTPFASIGLAVQVLQHQSESRYPEMRKATAELGASIAELHRMVKGVVKFAELVEKRHEPAFGYYDLARLVPTAVQPVAVFAQGREVDFRVMVPADLPQAHADPELLSEALYQMAHNAVKFNQPGGEAKVRVLLSGEYVITEIRDTGVGLTPEQQALLGQPFEQSADALRRGQEGLGIGWTLVRYVAEVHDGWLRAESPGPGEGSTFVLALPLAPEEG